MPDASRPIDSVLIDRYVAGECTSAEQYLVERWIAADPSHQKEVDDARLIREQTKQRIERSDAQAAWVSVTERLRLSAETGATNLASTRVGTRRFKSSALLRWIPLAAGIAVAAVVVWQGSARPWLKQSVREFATPAGGRESITLRDGTQLVLGPATRLRVPADFGVTTRSIELDGEAFFTVVHDVAHPFMVRAHNVVATDIGTQFDVRAYGDDPAVRVAVVEGRVGIDVGGGGAGPRPGPHNGNNDTLGAGDIATVTDTGIAIAHKANVAALTAWTQGRIVFDATPLADVARQLGRVFDLSITISDSALAAQPVTASYSDETPEQVLEDVTAVVGARYERVGRTVIIRRRTVGAERPVETPRPPLSTAQVIRSAPK